MKKKSRIAIAAARSGGHITPGMTLARQYCVQHPRTEILFFSTANNFDQQLIDQHDWPVTTISLSLDNVPQQWYRYPLFFVQLLYSFVKSFYYLLRYRPERVILMGGYISIPVCIAAWLLRIPRDLYELNAVPGSATKLLAPLATTIQVCFESAQSYFNSKKTVLRPYPVRFTNALANTNNQAQITQILDQHKPTLFILGGSQGSISLNKLLLTCLQEYPELAAAINIIHQTGAQDQRNWAQFYHDRGIPAITFDYHHDLGSYYQAADIIIGRAGAGTIFESLHFSKHCILIPLEIKSTDHQLHNAQAIAQQHPNLFTVIRQQELAVSTKSLAQLIKTFVLPQNIQLEHRKSITN